MDKKNREQPFMLFDAYQEMPDDLIDMFVLQEEAVISGRSVFDSHYLPMLEAQGVKFVSLSVGGDHAVQVIGSASENRFWDAHKKIDVLLTEEEAGCSSFRICRTKDDLERVLAGEEIGLVLGIAGGRPLEGKKNLNLLSSLRSLYRCGLRLVQLTGNGRNRLADGAGQNRTRGGLTGFGVSVVREAERLGMLIDTAQLSDGGFYDLISLTGGPVIDSHTAAAAVNPHPRCIDDNRIRAIADSGGVIGISFLAALIGGEGPVPGPEDLLRHIDHIAGLVGIEHVALGPDYSPMRTPVCRDRVIGYGNLGPDFCPFDRLTPLQSEKYPGWVEGIDYGIRRNDFVAGFASREAFPAIAGLLLDHGCRPDEAAGIAGGNMVRVLSAVLPASARNGD